MPQSFEGDVGGGAINVKSRVETKIVFKSWHQALDACWKFLKKPELHAYEINNWLHVCKAEIKCRSKKIVPKDLYFPTTSKKAPKEILLFESLSHAINELRLTEISNPEAKSWLKSWRYDHWPQGMASGEWRSLIGTQPVLCYLDIIEHETNLAKHELSRFIKREKNPSTNLIDFGAIEDLLFDARIESKAMASQRIIALGPKGCGKSAALNFVLSSTQIECFEYQILWHNWFLDTLKKFALFSRKYSMESDFMVRGAYDFSNVINCPLGDGFFHYINSSLLPREMEFLDNIRKHCAQTLTSAVAEQFMNSSPQDGWSFLLPCGNSHWTRFCINLRFGPWVLRVVVKTEEDVKMQLLRLSEMLRNPNFQINMLEDKAWVRESEVLDLLCVHMCGRSIGNSGDVATIKGWKAPEDIELFTCVREHLGKVFVYYGNGRDMQADRIYVRQCLKAWVGEIDPELVDCISNADTLSLDVRKKIGCALEAFDVWVPSDAMDEYCCITDAPGIEDDQPSALEYIQKLLLPSRFLLMFSGDPEMEITNSNIVKILGESGKLRMILDQSPDNNMIFVDIAEKVLHADLRAGLAVKPLDGNTSAEHEARAKKIKSDFQGWSEMVMNQQSESLSWLDLDDHQQLQNVRRMDQSQKIEKAFSRMEFFNIYPLTFDGLRMSSAKDFGRLIQLEDRTICTHTQCLEMTEIPALVNLFRQTQVRSSAYVAEKLKQELGGICNLLICLADLLGSLSSDVSNQVKCILAADTKKRGIYLTHLGKTEQDLYRDLHEQISDFRVLLKSNAPPFSPDRWFKFRDSLLVSSVEQRNRPILNFVNSSQCPQSESVAKLLHFLFGNTLSEFPKLWASFAAKAQTKSTMLVNKIKSVLTDYFLGTLPHSVLRAFIHIRVETICNMVERKLQKCLARILQVYSDQKDSAYWGAFRILHQTTQKALFSNLSVTACDSEAEVLAAIPARMSLVVDEGIAALLEAPARGLENLEHELTLESMCNNEIYTSLMSIAALSKLTQTSAGNLLRNFSEKLESVRNGLEKDCMLRDSMERRTAWNPLLRPAACDGSLVHGRVQRRSAVLKGREVDVYVPDVSCLQEDDSDGLLRCLAYASCQRDDAESVGLLRIRLCDFAFVNLNLFRVLFQAGPVKDVREEMRLMARLLLEGVGEILARLQATLISYANFFRFAVMVFCSKESDNLEFWPEVGEAQGRVYLRRDTKGFVLYFEEYDNVKSEGVGKVEKLLKATPATRLDERFDFKKSNQVEQGSCDVEAVEKSQEIGYDFVAGRLLENVNFLHYLLEDVEEISVVDAVRMMHGTKFWNGVGRFPEIFDFAQAEKYILEDFAWAFDAPESLHDVKNTLGHNRLAAIRIWMGSHVPPVVNSVLSNRNKTVDSLQPAIHFLRLLYSALHMLPERFLYEGPLYRVEYGDRNITYDLGLLFGFSSPTFFKTIKNLHDLKEGKGERILFFVSEGVGYKLADFSHSHPSEAEANVLMEGVTVLSVAMKQNGESEDLQTVHCHSRPGLVMLSGSPARKRELLIYRRRMAESSYLADSDSIALTLADLDYCPLSPSKRSAHVQLAPCDDRKLDGSGSTFRMCSRTSSRAYTVKAVDLERSDHVAPLLDRLQREAEALSQLRHWYIVACHGLLRDKDTLLLVMEPTEGDSLADFIQHQGSLSEGLAGHLLGQLAAALEYLHDEGVLHRDVNPHSLMLDRSPGSGEVLQLRLGDFGLDRAAVSSEATVNLHASPERAAGKVYWSADDMWAAGCVLVVMLTGRLLESPLFLSNHCAKVLLGATWWPAPLAVLLPRLLEKLPCLRLSARQLRWRLMASFMASNVDKETHDKGHQYA